MTIEEFRKTLDPVKTVWKTDDSFRRYCQEVVKAINCTNNCSIESLKDKIIQTAEQLREWALTSDMDRIIDVCHKFDEQMAMFRILDGLGGLWDSRLKLKRLLEDYLGVN